MEENTQQAHPSAVRLHPECKHPVRTGGAGAGQSGQRAAAVSFGRFSRGGVPCSAAMSSLAWRLEKGVEIYVGQCSEDQLLSPLRME